MSLEEELNDARQKLLDLEAESESNIKNYRADIERREQQKESGDDLQNFKGWVDEYEITSANAIAALLQRIAFLEAQINGEESQIRMWAHTTLEDLKEPYRAAWLQSGRKEEDFEAVWPQLKWKLLKARIFQELDGPFEPPETQPGQ